MALINKVEQTLITDKMKSIIFKNIYFYVIGFIIIFGLKHYYSEAGVDSLDWILAPTARWVGLLIGTTFKRVLHEGYINHAHRIIIAQSCSGINYLIISFSTLLFSFIHNLGTTRRKLLWIPSSLGLAYLLTIGINGLRIIFSIYLYKADIYNEWITPERVHLMEGTIVYFFSLLVVYNVMNKIVNHFEAGSNKTKTMINTFLPPLFWYFLITLGLPLLNGAYKNNKFMEYSVFIILVCLSAILALCSSTLLLKLLKNKFRNDPPKC